MMKILPWLAMLLGASACAAAADDRSLLFSFFRDNGQDGFYLATSIDGLVWTELHESKPLLKPTVGENKLMRDPSILQAPDGTFHMVWTTSWQGNTLGYASSQDLIHWIPQREIRPFADSKGILNCWAPELYYDEPTKEFWIIWASTIEGKFPQTAGSGSRDYNHRLYAIHTRNFQTFTPARLFYDPGFQVIDGAVFRDGNRYAMIAKNETEKPVAAKNLFLAFADKLDGPWSKAGNPISGPKWAEGPTPIRVGDYWYIYFDRYRDHAWGALRSKNLIGWEDVSSRLHMPAGARHGTAFRTQRGIVDGLR